MPVTARGRKRITLDAPLFGSGPTLMPVPSENSRVPPRPGRTGSAGRRGRSRPAGARRPVQGEPAARATRPRVFHSLAGGRARRRWRRRPLWTGADGRRSWPTRPAPSPARRRCSAGDDLAAGPHAVRETRRVEVGQAGAAAWHTLASNGAYARKSPQLSGRGPPRQVFRLAVGRVAQVAGDAVRRAVLRCAS